MQRVYWLSVALEVIGVSAILSGIYYEILYAADLGYVMISLGSALVAAGGLLFAKILPRKKLL